MKKNRFSQVMESVTTKLQKLIELEREAPRHQVEPKKEKQIRAFDEKKRRAFDPEDLEDQDKALDPGEREELMEETLEELFKAHQAINSFAENTITAVHVLAQALLRSDPDMDPKVRAAVEYLTDVDLWGDDGEEE